MMRDNRYGVFDRIFIQSITTPATVLMMPFRFLLSTDSLISAKYTAAPILLLTVLMIFLTGFANSSAVTAQFGDDLIIRGYFQGMPIRISVEIPDQEDGMAPGGLPAGNQTWWEYRLQNRINMRWYASPELTFTWEMRTRFFAGDLVKDMPGYAQAIDVDDGFFNLSWMMVEQDDWLLHYIPDRLYGEWANADWSVRVGRQRVNWGINTITNPNDLFNIYSFYDFDYPERPGSDAIRVQRFLGFASRMEVALSPARDLEKSVAAALYAFNTRGYDIQLIGGYYRERLAAGGGWAGSIGGAGFKGEAMLFAGSRSVSDGTPGIPGGSGLGIGTPGNPDEYNLIASVSGDYMFGSGVFLMAEFLFNKEGGRDQFTLFSGEFSPDNPSFSRYQFTTMATYAITPLLDGSLSAVWYPDEDAVFVSPSLTRSLLTDLDLRILGQFFVGGDDSAFSNAGNVLAASLRWNF